MVSPCRYPLEMLRIAHVSDLHVLSSAGVEWRKILFNKRITGYANLVLRRSRVYRREYLLAVLEAAAKRGSRRRHRRHHEPRARERVRGGAKAARRRRTLGRGDGRSRQPRHLPAVGPARASLSASLRYVSAERPARSSRSTCRPVRIRPSSCAGPRRSSRCRAPCRGHHSSRRATSARPSSPPWDGCWATPKWPGARR